MSNNPTPFELATQAHAMGDLYNTLRFLLQDNLDLRTQIRALQNRAMGLPAVPDPDQEIGFVRGLDKCGRCGGTGIYVDRSGKPLICECQLPIRIHDETDIH